MADQVPAQVARAERNLGLRFLHLVLTKQMQTESGHGADGVRRLAFAHGQQSDGGRIPVGAGAGRLNPLLNGDQVRGRIHAGKNGAT